MKAMQQHFFTDEEKDAIERAIRNAESRTVGEIAVIVVGRSDKYRNAAILGASLLSILLAALIIAVNLGTVPWYYIFPVTAALLVPSLHLFKKAHQLRAPLIGNARKEEATRQRAIQAFHERGLHNTRQHTGVLFFVSLMERRVWVLADSGIYEKIGQDTLDRYAYAVSNGIRHGHACEALCKAIANMGTTLARHFPPLKEDTNELPDNVMEG